MTISQQSTLRMDLSPQQLIMKLPDFWQQIRQFSQALGIDIDALTADHLAIRINDLEEAKQAHQAWLAQGKQISNAMINGRPIIVIEFNDPLVIESLAVNGHKIECLELPYPSEKTYPNEGWEHVEFVVPSKAQTIDQFVDDVKQAFPELNKRWDSLADQGISIKLSSPKGEGERLANPTVAFKLVGSKEKSVCIKLHPHSIKEVILSEQE